jgi:hypothetical protein
MAQGRAEKSTSKPKRKKKEWQPPPRELDRLVRGREQARPVNAAIQDFARVVMRELYGEEGPKWGTSFADIETVSSTIGKAVATALASQAVAAQAKGGVPDEHSGCPGCQALTRLVAVEPRSLQTLDGLVEWWEPEHTCERCRKSFFPSEPRAASGFGAGQSGAAAAAQ